MKKVILIIQVLFCGFLEIHYNHIVGEEKAEQEFMVSEELIVFLGILTDLENVNAVHGDGVRVKDVIRGSPAEATGVLEGDHVVKFDDKQIESIVSLVTAQKFAFKKVQSGDLIDMTIVRNGNVIIIKIPALIVHKKSFSNLLNLLNQQKVEAKM